MKNPTPLSNDEVHHAYQTLRKGDLLSDRDLDGLLAHFESLSEALTPLGETFYFAWREANDRVIALRGYVAARKSY